MYTLPPTYSEGVPDQLETERLLIRAVQASDAFIVHASVNDSFPALHQWMPWAREPQTFEQSETFARESAARFRNREELGYLLFRKDNGAHIGAIGFHAIDWNVPRLEIGYWLRTDQEGNGYMTEAVRALTALAFNLLYAERLEIRCDARNTRSAAVAQRAGYELEATLHRQARDTEGHLRDTLVFACFPKERV